MAGATHDSHELQHFRFSVRVEPRYEPKVSSLLESSYVFSYKVRIENTGQIAAKVSGRHWIVTDATNRTEEINKDGVLGQTPYLKPGDVFEYVGECPLPTKVGTMKGSFRCSLDSGTLVDVIVPEFVLAVPNALH
jgi:ApaG protein